MSCPRDHYRQLRRWDLVRLYILLVYEETGSSRVNQSVDSILPLGVSTLHFHSQVKGVRANFGRSNLRLPWEALLPLRPFWRSFASSFCNYRGCGSTFRDFFYRQHLKLVGGRGGRCIGRFWRGRSRHLSFLRGYSMKFLRSAKQSLPQRLDVDSHRYTTVYRCYGSVTFPCYAPCYCLCYLLFLVCVYAVWYDFCRGHLFFFVCYVYGLL